jgi:hypothetical protein
MISVTTQRVTTEAFSRRSQAFTTSSEVAGVPMAAQLCLSAVDIRPAGVNPPSPGFQLWNHAHRAVAAFHLT